MSDGRIVTARQLMESWELDQAMALLKEALQENPQDSEIRQTLMELQELQMLDMQLQERLRKARALAEEGQKEQALKAVAEVLKIAPGHSAALGLQNELSPPVASGWDLGAPSLQESPLAAEPGAAQDFAFGELPAAPASDFGLADLPPAPEGGFGLADLPPVPASDFDMPAAPVAEGFAFDAPAPPGFEFDAPPAPMEMTSLSAPAGPASSSLSPQEQAKVNQYIAEGKALMAEGQIQAAIDLWTRVFILDEENAEAQMLVDQARASLNANQGELDYALNEGIAAFNAGDFARAKPLLEKILQLSPGHREALYYLSRFPAEAPEAEAAPDFELEGDFAAPAVQSPFEVAAPSPSPFEAAAPSPFSAPPPPPAAEPQVAATPPPPPLFSPGAPSAPPPSRFGGVQDDGAFEVETGSSDEVASAFPAVSEPAPVPPPPAPAPPVAAPRVGAKPLPQKKQGPGLKLILGGLAGLVVLGAGIFIVPKLLGGGEPPPPPKTSQQTPPKTTPSPAPDPAPEPVQPVGPQTKEEFLKAAREAMNANNYQQAVDYYKQALSLDPLDPDAQGGIESARAALARQQEEQARNAKFLKDYQSSVKSYRDGDYGEALRLAWRLIYPDDSLAKQLGKANSVRLLLRNGYYNWAVRDLKSENARGAEKNLKDLLDADRNDAEAKRLLEFAQKYAGKPVDAAYRDTVAALSYRSFEEIP